jgi:hypothetical protein
MRLRCARYSAVQEQNTKQCDLKLNKLSYYLLFSTAEAVHVYLYSCVCCVAIKQTQSLL